MARYPVLRVFLVVCAGAIFGMLLGGVFGRWAGGIAPHFFTAGVDPAKSSIPVDPVGMGTVLGAAGGVLCGGGLSVFAYAVHVSMEWIATRKGAAIKA